MRERSKEAIKIYFKTQKKPVKQYRLQEKKHLRNPDLEKTLRELQTGNSTGFRQAAESLWERSSNETKMKAILQRVKRNRENRRIS